jgi:hypothetical protein
MKIAVLKIGGRLTWDARDKTGGLGEAKAIIELLSASNDIFVYTKTLEKENLNPKENIYIRDINEYNSLEEDVLLVFNGNLNLFGGAEDKEQIKNYIFLNNFKGKIFYVWIDPELYLKQAWPSIEKKEWSVNYKKEEVEVVRIDINIITSIYNTKSAIERFSKGKIQVDDKNIFYFPFEKYPLLYRRRTPMSTSCYYDLLYTGTYRSGRRQDKMIKYYFGYENIKSTFIGKTKLEDFNKSYPTPVPEFKSAVEFDKIKYDINNCIASINIGDKFYEGNILTPRIYECIHYSTVCLIDSEFDPQKRVFTNPILKDFNYVSSKKEAEEKILKLKENPDFRKQIIELQRSDISFNVDDYRKQFMEILC